MARVEAVLAKSTARAHLHMPHRAAITALHTRHKQLRIRGFSTGSYTAAVLAVRRGPRRGGVAMPFLALPLPEVCTPSGRPAVYLAPLRGITRAGAGAKVPAVLLFDWRPRQAWPPISWTATPCLSSHRGASHMKHSPGKFNEIRRAKLFACTHGAVNLHLGYAYSDLAKALPNVDVALGTPSANSILAHIGAALDIMIGDHRQPAGGSARIVIL